MTDSAIALPDLPPPGIIEELDFEAILSRKKATLLALEPAFAETLALESEPSTKLLEAAAYDELLLRQRVNDALRSGLLAFAAGAELDHFAVAEGISRLAGEKDEAFRARIHLGIRGRRQGAEEYYRYQALSAAAGIRDVYTDVEETPSNEIFVYVLPESGAEDPGVLAAVQSHLTDQRVRLLNDRPVVVWASLVPIRARARIWLRPDALPGLAENLRATFPETFEKERGLGWDVARSWTIARLHASGVKRVEILSPETDIPIENHACAVLEDFELIEAGTQW